MLTTKGFIMSFNIYLVRHGQTILNRYNRMQGWCDSSLTDLGVKQAHTTGKRLAHIKFDHAFHSDTMRAATTCEGVLSENKNTLPQPIELANFREQGYGYFEGADSGNAWFIIGGSHGCKTFAEIIEKYSIEEARDFAKAADPFNNAENNAEFWQRLDEGFAKVKNIAHDNQNILIVSHGTTIRSIIHHFDPTIDISISPKNGCVSKLVMTNNSVNVAYFNHYLDTDTY